VIGLVVLLVVYLAIVEIISRAAITDGESTPSSDTLGASHP
jgi:hypothetical protein